MSEPNSCDDAKYIRRIQKKFQNELSFEKKLKYLKYLNGAAVSLQILKETAIGKTINALRKEDGVVGELAGQLVLKWKDIALQQQQYDSSSSPSKKIHEKKPYKNLNGFVNDSTSSCNQNYNNDNSIVSNKTPKIKKEVSTSSGSKPQIYPHTPEKNKTRISDHTFTDKSEYKHNESFSPNAAESVAESSSKKPDKLLYDEKCDILNKQLKKEKEENQFSSNKVDAPPRKKLNRSFEEMLMMPLLPTKKKKKHAEQQSNAQSQKVEPKMPTLPDIELPQISAVPVYHPRRPTSAVDSGEMVKKKVEPVLKLNAQDFMSRKTKSVMYTGKKVLSTGVISLYQLSMRVLIDNVDSLYETGGVPFSVLEPVLTKCTPSQLERLEYYNPHFVEDTDALWKMHCQHDFKCARIDENTVGAWRDKYKDLGTEREYKLRKLSSKISASQAAKVPERSVKLAFVATAPKPSVQMLRKQKKFGTGDKLKKVEAPIEEKTETQKDIRKRMEKEQRESIAEHIPFAKVPHRERCSSKRPPSSLHGSTNEAPVPKRKKEKEELGSHGPAELMPDPTPRKKKKGKTPMMLKTIRLLKSQKGRLAATIMRK